MTAFADIVTEVAVMSAQRGETDCKPKSSLSQSSRLAEAKEALISAPSLGGYVLYFSTL